MFVCNLKLSPKLIFKIFFVIIFLIVMIVAGWSFYKIFNYNNNACMPSSEISNISSDNYTNILKSVHENLDDYVGQKIHFSGYVYRVYDFSENQFVLARNMIISSDKQTVVVGFLCEYKNASEFKDNTWVDITGEIEKGDYHGSIPVIKITRNKSLQ